jgi:acetyltransferase-like isoleucine patch superfamily enzyme
MSNQKQNFLSQKEIFDLKIKKVGKDVLISKDARLYNTSSLVIGDNSRIDDFCIISGNIKIGKNVHLAPHCIINGGKSLIEFGDFSGLAFGAKVLGISDDYSGETMTNPTINKEFKNVQDLSVKLGKHVIIGANSVILPGCRMGDGSALGALSLLTKNVNEFEIYFGIPARKINDRKRNILELEKNLE